jgi:hypothetical protein
MTLSSYLSTDNTRVFTDKQDNVLLRICELGISFSTELARDTDTKLEDMNSVLYQLKSNKFIDKTYPDTEGNNPLFRGRMFELNSKGLVGLSAFSKFSWWTLTLPGFEYIKSKYTGQGKRIKGSLVMRLKLNVEPEEIKNKELTEEEKQIFNNETTNN